MLKVISAVALLAFAASAKAEVYKCRNSDGRLQFQPHPCEGVESEKVHVWIGKGSGAAGNIISIGMTKDEVIASWGKPDDINTTINQFGRSEQWVYDRGNFRRQYVYFDNGIVSSIQSDD